MNAFTLELDKVLKNINSDYKAKRTNDFILKLPKVQVAKTGTFYTWLKKKEKLGGQNKIPRLNNHRRIIEDIINLN